MSKQRDITLFVVDIFVSIRKIKAYTSDFDDAKQFLHSSLHWDATIRQLEIIGIALSRLLEDERFNTYAPKYFRKVVNFRNVIVHGYFGINEDEVWNVVTEKLELLEGDLKKIIESHLDISAALASVIEEYENGSDVEIVNYLMKLKEKK